MRPPKIPKSILERRRSIRITEVLAFRIGNKDYEMEARTLNISCHGAMCVVDKDIPMMTQLDIALKLPGQKMIRVKGVVVRKEEDPLNEKFHVAIFFSEISPYDTKRLRQFIECRSKG